MERKELLALSETKQEKKKVMELWEVLSKTEREELMELLALFETKQEKKKIISLWKALSETEREKLMELLALLETKQEKKKIISLWKALSETEREELMESLALLETKHKTDKTPKKSQLSELQQLLKPKEPYSNTTLKVCEHEPREFSHNHYLDLLLNISHKETEEIKMSDFVNGKKGNSINGISLSQIFIEYFKEYVKINDTITYGDLQYLFTKRDGDDEYYLVKQIYNNIYPLECASVININMNNINKADKAAAARYFCKGFDCRTRINKSYYVPILVKDVKNLVDNKTCEITKHDEINDETTISGEVHDQTTISDEETIKSLKSAATDKKNNVLFRKKSKIYETRVLPTYNTIFFAIDIKKTVETDVVHIILLKIDDLHVKYDGLFVKVMTSEKEWIDFKKEYNVNESLL
jgi:hypothetical protein